jgi:hypothetical protein
MRNLFISISLWVCLASPAMANRAVEQLVPNGQAVGTGRLSVVFWDVYDATLYAPNKQWDANAPHALTVDYFREIDGIDIADRSAEEIQKQGFSNKEALSKWLAQMRAIFPNVKNGSQITAVFTKQKSTDFYYGDKPIGSIKDPEFGRLFFDIWLSEKTSEPQLRKKLLGLS